MFFLKAIDDRELENRFFFFFFLMLLFFSEHIFLEKKKESYPREIKKKLKNK